LRVFKYISVKALPKRGAFGFPIPKILSNRPTSDPARTSFIPFT